MGCGTSAQGLSVPGCCGRSHALSLCSVWSCARHCLPESRNKWLSTPLLTLNWTHWELRARSDAGLGAEQMLMPRC